ncbi:MAG: HU family DNA-binding protein [Polyangiaceae bacterium]
MAGKKTEKKASALSKSALVNAVLEASGEEISRRQVKAILEAMASVGYKELKRNGIFTVPGFAKFKVVKKPATKAREGINPFTKEPMVYKAKPASKSVRARPIKAIKDAMS